MEYFGLYYYFFQLKELIIEAKVKNLLKLPTSKGFLTGMLLQLAIGPVFFYLLGITISSEILSGICGVIGVTLADYIYIFLSIIGVGALLEKDRTKKIFTIVSSIVLIGFGIQFIFSSLIIDSNKINGFGHIWTPFTSFIDCFMLTISSPLTILFWGSIFTTRANENKYNRNQLISFALGAGLSTLVFLSLTMFILSYFKSVIPEIAIQVLNLFVGFVVIYFGIAKIVKYILNTNENESA